MILINKQEASAIRTIFGNGVHIRRTCPQKSNRHRYHMEENPWAMKALAEYQGGAEVGTLKKSYSRYKNYNRFY